MREKVDENPSSIRELAELRAKCARLERELLEERRREGQHFLQAIEQAFPNWIYVFDFDLMSITYTNHSILGELGYSDEIQRSVQTLQAFSRFIPEDELSHLTRLIEEWQALEDGQFRDDEYLIRHADGSIHSFAGREVVFARRPDGTVQKILGTLSNITTLKQIKAALQQSEQQFASFMQHLPGLAWIKDEAGRYVFVNTAAAKVFDMPASRLMGKTDTEIFPPETAQQFQLSDRKAWLSDSAVRMTESLKHPDGVVHHSLVSKFTLPGPVGCSRMIGGIAIDITDHKLAEEALRESESRYRLIAELASSFSYQATVHRDRELSFHWVVGKFEEVTGYRPDELSGTRWQSLLPQEELFRIQERAKNSDLPIADWKDASEHRIITRSGELRWIRSVVHVVRPASPGQPMTIYGAVLDITERKRDEEALQMMRFSVDHAADTVFWISRTGRILYANHAGSLVRGYSHEELLEMTIFDLDPDFPPQVWDPHFEELKRKGSMTFETRHRAKDGRVFPIEVNANYVHIGNQEFNFAFVRDITERRQAEMALRENEARFRLLFEGASDAIVWADVETGIITHCNQAAERLFGRDRSEIIGQSQAVLHPPEEMERYRELFRIHASSQSMTPMEVEVIRKDGRRVDVSISPSITEIAGQRIIQGIFRDISDRKRMEAEQSIRQRDLLHASRLNAIGQMVAGLSHEVAQPLSAIANFAQACSRILESFESEQSAALREYTRAITEQSRRCGAILQRLRDFSRRAPSVRSVCDLNTILAETKELIASESKRHKSNIRLELASTLPQVTVDSVQIQQVVVNLLYNGLDAVREQPPERRQLIVRSFQDGEWVGFEVEDHGSGIASGVADSLFEPFFTTKREGMGIGLNICQTIVRDHGGKIAAGANAHGGATFRVHLPVSSLEGAE